MANEEHVALIKKDVAAWNAWRDEDRKNRLRPADRKIRPDLYGAKLSGRNLNGADLSVVNLMYADLSGVNLSNADLSGADLCFANVSGAILSGANLTGANMMETDFRGSDLTGCRIHGVSAWDLKLGGAKQQSLVITTVGEPEITVDNIEVARFIYLILNNQKVREAIDTITSKVVLILGRFTDERKAVLDALHEELRKRNYLPILFDFAVPATRDITETISLLARMARFVVADITDGQEHPAGTRRDCTRPAVRSCAAASARGQQ
jgi:hypothetical protein